MVRTIDKISDFLVIFNGLPSHVGYCIHTLHGFIEGSVLHIPRQASPMGLRALYRGQTYLCNIFDHYIFKVGLSPLEEFGKVFAL